MTEKYYVKLSEIIEKLGLIEVCKITEEQKKKRIYHKEVNRPGLFLAGFQKNFDPERIQILGRTEYDYLESLSEEERASSIRSLMERRPVCVILCHGRGAREVSKRYAEEFGVPLLMSHKDTSYFMSALISLLNVALADRITRHGVMVEVYGEGILILGDSGVGKSETAVELIKRGHRLIADDAVEIKKVSSKTLVGSSPDNIRHFMELRGIGIVNARNIFGVGAVKLTEKIDMVIQLEHWDSQKSYDRLGLDDEYISILGINVPTTTVPVKPGRNLAIIIEIAAMNNRQKKLGYNAARELMQQLGMEE